MKSYLLARTNACSHAIFMFLAAFFLAGGCAAQTPIKEPAGKVQSKVYAVVDTMPQFPGGDSAFLQYWRNSVGADVKLETCDAGYVVYHFVVDASGEVRDIVIDWDKSGNNSTMVLKTMAGSPRWEPGKKDGVPVSTLVRAHICFGGREITR